MASALAIAGLAVALFALWLAWSALCTAQRACGLADDALDSIALLGMPVDAILTLEDGDQAEFRLERGALMALGSAILIAVGLLFVGSAVVGVTLKRPHDPK